MSALPNETLDELSRVFSSANATFSHLAMTSNLNPKSDFKSANLSEVDFRGSDLRGYDFSNSDLTNTNWEDAIYDHTTVLNGADLSGAIALKIPKRGPGQSAQNSTFHEHFAASQHIDATGPIDCQFMFAKEQLTLAKPCTLDGIGLHKGTLVHLTLRPAAADTGIIFRRTDLETKDRAITDIQARYDNVTDATMCTTIGNAAGSKVAAIEHLMAALAAYGISNLIAEVDAEEVPVMDGSSDAFVQMIASCGLSGCGKPRRAIRILEGIEIEDGLRRGSLTPLNGFGLNLSIDFDNQVIGHQKIEIASDQEGWFSELSAARTFGFLKDIEMLRSLGLAQGATLENAVVLDGEDILNDGGLRSPDEFIRHKALDAIGDLSLLGMPIVGQYSSTRPGHAFNNQVLYALMANPSCFEYIDLPDLPEDQFVKIRPNRNLIIEQLIA